MAGWGCRLDLLTTHVLLSLALMLPGLAPAEYQGLPLSLPERAGAPVIRGGRHGAPAPTRARAAQAPASTASAPLYVSPRSAFSTSDAGGSKRSPYFSASSRARATNAAGPVPSGPS